MIKKGEKRKKQNISQKLKIEHGISGQVDQDQLYDLLLSRELSWQEIIYDLIQSEQLDPWNIDLGILSQKYLERIQQMEEENFFISSKVLLAAAILLRIKSEFLLNRYIKSLDEVLFGLEKKEAKPIERIEIDDIPELIPKTPLPRLKKVSLQELMQALDRAMITEHRRIKKDLIFKQAVRHINIVLPKFKFNIREKIKEIYDKVKAFFKGGGKNLTFFYLTQDQNKEEKVSTFMPLLHLDHQEKILLEQERHFADINISLKK